MSKFVSLLVAGLLLVVMPVFATDENFQFDTPQQRQLFLELTEELRCPKCQNQNIADSDAMIATDLRRKVYELIQQGYSREQVVDFMKQRYGEFVSYNPPLTIATVWLWVLPLMFVIGGGVCVLAFRKTQPVAIDAERRAQAERLLEKD